MAAINGNTDTIAAVGAVLLGIVAVIVGMYGFKRAFTYQLESSRLVIRLLGVTVRTVRVAEIDDVEVVPFESLIPFSRFFRRDLFVSDKLCGYSKRVVAVRRRGGTLKRIILSPQDPETFADSLRRATAAN